MGKAEASVVQMENMTEPGGLKRDLRLRHMVMIAISGTIGTGLFLTSGKTIATAGPLGARRCPLQQPFSRSKSNDGLYVLIFTILCNSVCLYDNRRLACICVPGNWGDRDLVAAARSIHKLGRARIR